MPQPKNQTNQSQIPEGTVPGEAEPRREIDEETVVKQPEYRLPGAAVVTREDRENLDARADEPTADVDIYEAPLRVPNDSSDANGEARDNIVPDGPGTYGPATENTAAPDGPNTEDGRNDEGPATRGLDGNKNLRDENDNKTDNKTHGHRDS